MIFGGTIIFGNIHISKQFNVSPYKYTLEAQDQTKNGFWDDPWIQDSGCYQWAKFGIWTSWVYIYIWDIYIYIQTHTHIYVYIYIQTHTHIYVYIYIQTHTHICIYIYTYIQTSISQICLFNLHKQGTGGQIEASRLRHLIFPTIAVSLGGSLRISWPTRR